MMIGARVGVWDHTGDNRMVVVDRDLLDMVEIYDWLIAHGIDKCVVTNLSAKQLDNKCVVSLVINSSGDYGGSGYGTCWYIMFNYGSQRGMLVTGVGAMSSTAKPGFIAKGSVLLITPIDAASQLDGSITANA